MCYLTSSGTSFEVAASTLGRRISGTVELVMMRCRRVLSKTSCGSREVDRECSGRHHIATQ